MDQECEQQCLQYIEIVFLATAASCDTQEPEDMDDGDDVEVGIDTDEVFNILCKLSASSNEVCGELAAFVLGLLARTEAVVALARSEQLREARLRCHHHQISSTIGLEEVEVIDEFPSDEGACKHLVSLLSRTDHSSTRALRALSALLEGERDPVAVERLQHDLFVQQGLISLVNIIHNRDDDHARAAIHVLRNAVARSNECKSSLDDEVGFLNFAAEATVAS
jgi:hypothetical protein